MELSLRSGWRWSLQNSSAAVEIAGGVKIKVRDHILSFCICKPAHIMPLFLRPADEEDSPRIGRIGQAAFQHSLSQALFPTHLHSKSETGDPRLDEAHWRAARTTRRMREGKLTFVVVEGLGVNDSDAEVVGFSQWELPSQGESPAIGAAENG